MKEVTKREIWNQLNPDTQDFIKVLCKTMTIKEITVGDKRWSR